MQESEASKALREIALMAPRKGGPKLMFSTKCAAYAALLENISPALIARVFGLSRTSVSHLAGCRDDTRPPITMELPDLQTFTEEVLTDDKQSTRRFVDVVRRNVRTYVVGDLNITRGRRPAANRPARYQDVAREFNHLGYDAFKTVYFTEEWQRRLKAAAQTHLAGDPAAAVYAFINYGPVQLKTEFFRIDYQPDGWRYSQCYEDGSPRWSDEHSYMGDRDTDKPFMTSEAVYKYLIQ